MVLVLTMITDEGGSSDRENFSFDFSFFSHIQWKSFRTSYNTANNNESKLTTSALFIYIYIFIIFYVKKFRLFYYYDEDETIYFDLFVRIKIR